MIKSLRSGLLATLLVAGTSTYALCMMASPCAAKTVGIHSGNTYPLQGSRTVTYTVEGSATTTVGADGKVVNGEVSGTAGGSYTVTYEIGYYLDQNNNLWKFDCSTGIGTRLS